VPAGPERDAYVAKLREEYKEDIDLMKLASELVVDAVVPGERLRAELAARFARYAEKDEPRPRKKHLVSPV
jgi:acetyl-CoA carboxylase carboxyltransferase component